MQIALIGAGNVGYHLGLQFHAANIQVTQVFSRKLENAQLLANLIQSSAYSNIEDTRAKADIYILAVQDNAIEEVAKSLADVGLGEKLIVHTSGATPTTILRDIGLKRYGVFYPLQTMSRSSSPDFSQIPICVDACNLEDLELLKGLAAKISPKVYHISDEQRAVLHVAAVFVNNFSNHLFQISHNILNEKGISFDLLIPLIKETAAKLDKGTPEEIQTGPAKRGDLSTIERHLSILQTYPEYQHIYKILSASISRTQQKS